MQRPSIASDPPPILTTHFPTTNRNVTHLLPHQNSLAHSPDRSITNITGSPSETQISHCINEADPVHAMKVHRANRSTAPLIHNFDTGGIWVVYFMPRSLYSRQIRVSIEQEADTLSTRQQGGGERVLFCQLLPKIRKSTAFIWRFPDFAFCPSNKWYEDENGYGALEERYGRDNTSSVTLSI